MFIKKAFVTLSSVATATIVIWLLGCAKMDMTTTTPPVNIIEGSFDTPLLIPTVLNPQNLVLEAKTTPATWLQGKISERLDISK